MAGGQGWESLSRKRPDSFQDFIPGLNNTLADLGPWQPIGGTNCNFYKIMPRNKTPNFAADYFGKFTVPLFWHSNSNLAVFSLLPPVSFPSSWSECESGSWIPFVSNQSEKKIKGQQFIRQFHLNLVPINRLLLHILHINISTAIKMTIFGFEVRPGLTLYWDLDKVGDIIM